MKTCSHCNIEKPITEFHRQTQQKDGLRKICKPCRKTKAAADYLVNKDRQAITGAIWRDNNKAMRAATHSAYYEANKERENTIARKWYLANKDYVDAINLARNRANPAPVRARCAARNAKKLYATPLWVNLDAIKCYYQVAEMLNREGIEKWQVDHIIPLQGRLVSGLHVHNNLQVITATANQSKGNRYTVA